MFIQVAWEARKIYETACSPPFLYRKEQNRAQSDLTLGIGSITKPLVIEFRLYALLPTTLLLILLFEMYIKLDDLEKAISSLFKQQTSTNYDRL